MSEKQIRKNFYYSAIEDSDIQEWFNSLPPKSHSEYIRKAIRHFMEREEFVKLQEQDEYYKRLKLIENELQLLKRDVGLSPHIDKINELPEKKKCKILQKTKATITIVTT